jgi:PIN domain nuclease of toxin-antitoxin system
MYQGVNYYFISFVKHNNNIISRRGTNSWPYVMKNMIVQTVYLLEHHNDPSDRVHLNSSVLDKPSVTYTEKYGIGANQ